jgi:hypothetical protein
MCKFVYDKIYSAQINLGVITLRNIFQLQLIDFWVVRPCSSERARRFGELYCLHLHDVRVSKAHLAA